MPPQLTIEESTDGTHVVLAVVGEIDLATAAEFEARIESAGSAASIVLDMTQVAFIDSTGLRVLLSAHERADDGGGRLAIVAGEGPVTKLLAITGVDEWLNVHETRSSATSDG